LALAPAPRAVKQLSGSSPAALRQLSGSSPAALRTQRYRRREQAPTKPLLAMTGKSEKSDVCYFFVASQKILFYPGPTVFLLVS
jgi:hypothetical protein